MKSKIINHPLRTIQYKYRENSFQLNHEAKALTNYRLAHDQVWRMKQLFEKEKSECQLTLIDLLLLDEERIDRKITLDFYLKDTKLSKSKIYLEIEPNLQVELRNFYNDVIDLHHRIVKFYDRIGILDKEYTLITDCYFRNEKPIDPLNFQVLKSIFDHYEDMQIDVVSLDKDLQEFIATMTNVYALLDQYLLQFNDLYSAYSNLLKSTAILASEVQVLNKIWGE